MTKNMTAYAASKAGVAALAEGLYAEFLNSESIDVSTIYPGFIATEMNESEPRSKKPFIIDAKKACPLLVNAIEKKPRAAMVPWWPWAPLSLVQKYAPLGVLNRII